MTSSTDTIHPFFDKGARLILPVGLVFTLVMAGVYLYRPHFYAAIERQASDALLIQTHRERASGIPVVVDIDGRTQAEYGPWPWPRHRLARLLDKLEAAGAQSIGLSMVLSQFDPASPSAIGKQWEQDWGVKVEFQGLDQDHFRTDEELARVLKNGPHALGYRFKYNTTTVPSRCRLHPLLGSREGSLSRLPESLNLRRASATLCGPELFFQVVQGSGFLDYFEDPDGVVRRMPLVISHGGELFPSLALATLMAYLDYREIEIRETGRGALGLVVGEFTIPIDSSGDMMLHFRGKQKAYDYISAADVLGDNLLEDRLKGKIVFVGTDSLASQNHLSTPFEDDFPMVGLHATVVDTILTRDHIHRPDYALIIELTMMVVFGLLVTLLMSRAGSKWSLAVLFLCVLGIWGGAHLMTRSMGIMITPIAPMIAIVGNFVILILVKYSREERQLRKRNLELSQTQAAAIRGLASLAETRDPETGGHILRTQRYVKVLAEQLKQHPLFAPVLDDDVIDQYFNMAPLHDIGKVGIPDHILLKPGPLTDEEFTIMKTHTTIGGEALEKAQKEIRENSFFLHAIEIARCHQEKWDGSGYPKGLKGREIPLSARLMAVADVYDALISRRVYKPPFPHEKAVSIILEGRGTHFDPDLVDAFEAVQETFHRIAREYSEKDEVLD